MENFKKIAWLRSVCRGGFLVGWGVCWCCGLWFLSLILCVGSSRFWWWGCRRFFFWRCCWLIRILLFGCSLCLSCVCCVLYPKVWILGVLWVGVRLFYVVCLVLFGCCAFVWLWCGFLILPWIRCLPTRYRIDPFNYRNKLKYQAYPCRLRTVGNDSSLTEACRAGRHGRREERDRMDIESVFSLFTGWDSEVCDDSTSPGAGTAAAWLRNSLRFPARWKSTTGTKHNQSWICK